MSKKEYYTPREVFKVNTLDKCTYSPTFLLDLAERMEEPELGNPPFEVKGGKEITTKTRKL